jgi:hypothetical protein
MEEVERAESGGIGFTATESKLSHAEVSKVVDRVIKERTPPEFRNRLKELGGIAVFQSLTAEMMKLVVRRDFKDIQALINASGYFFSLSVTEAAIDEALRQALAGKGNLSNVKSLITKEIQIPLGIEATKLTIKPGDSVIVDVEFPQGAETVGANSVVDKVFFFEIGDALGQPTTVSGFESLLRSPAEAASSPTLSDEDLTDEDRQMLASLFSIGNSNLVGARSMSMLLMAVEGGVQRESLGFGFADQLNKLGLMPKTPAAFTDLHNLTLLSAMSLIKSQVELYPELARSYTLEVKQDKSFMTLVRDSQEIVSELVTLLGVRIKDTKMHHDSPYTYTMEVEALPQAILMARTRFPKLVIKAG